MRTLVTSESALALHRAVNATFAPYPLDRSVADLFGDCVRRSPDATAVVCGGDSLTYRELDRMANGLASRLSDLGVRPGASVGLCVPRSLELIVALLAILKAGAAYLPFDASWPDERLHGVFADAGCACLILPAGREEARRFGNHRIVAIDRTSLQPADRGPDVVVPSDAVAYVNFTSGSTGKPKGVPIQHRSIVRLACAARYARLDPHTRVLNAAPVTFDAATFEIWGPLLNGGTCVLYPAAFIRFSLLRQTLETHRVNLVFLTTALFNAIVDEAPETLDGVETILFGGEALSMKHVLKAVNRYGGGRLANVYGPTESTTFATCFPITDIAPDARDLPIGRPIQNTRVYVINDGMLCGANETGDLHIAGPGLSPGYLGRPDLTAERFITYDIGGRTERVYRTGDRVCLRSDGDIVFLGRLDDQVKISGFRIELGEIAHHLDQHPAVRQSFVTCDEAEAGGKILAAFVVGDRCAVEDVRNHLKSRLPAYMMPSRIEIRDSLPLNANGKVDRLSLLRSTPSPEPSHDHQ